MTLSPPSHVRKVEPNLQIIPARKGRGVRMSKGQSIRLINTYGTQVVDTWAFNAHNLGERMSMEHTRAYLDKIFPAVKDTFVTNQRSPILTILEDTTPGNHDILMPACDVYRYAKQYCLKEYHDNCTDNLRHALESLGEKGEEYSPSPFNVFMNIPLKDDNSLSWEASTAKAGQYITFKAEMDLIIVFSACPNDVLPINGNQSRDAHFLIF
ncbi:hypothetical protein BP6252_12517 [Coleophoma cylindrospora]|uniref:DUF1989 domain-containing protein n=1 Tax=Coleophoma cylindrospora TaxID=1849047 RepID=A0A3D8QCQ6_9HELO|nr:hypothetical protein BP6252_12517 [Coleophoma cylindrospora]